jgi:hypothetical protein
MTKEELLELLKVCAKHGDTEVAHQDADTALVSYINDPEIAEAYEQIDKWYA